MTWALSRIPTRSLGWLVPIVVCTGLLAGFVVSQPASPPGDTIALVHGARQIESCAAHGIHSDCDSRFSWTGLDGVSTDVYHGRIEGDVGPYPLFQYLPAIVATELGAGDAAVYRSLQIINLVAFCTLLGLALLVGLRSRRRWVTPLLALMLTTSPLLIYAGLTFGEALAALLVALFVVAALLRWSAPVLAFATVAACLTKETAFPFVAVIGAVCLIWTPLARRDLRPRHWWGLATGIVGGEMLNVAFDWFRYRQLTNFTYGHPFEKVPGIGRRLDFSVAMWVAPNTGVLFYWLLAALLVGFVVVLTVNRLRRRAWRSAVPPLAISIVVILLTGVLASWYSPFGWDAWGPRLLLPMLPGVLIAIIVLNLDPLEQAIRAILGRPLGLIASAVLLAGFGLAEVNLLHHTDAIGALFTPDRTCPTPVSITQPSYYYRCVHHLAWSHHWVLPTTYRALTKTWGIVFAAGFLTSWVSLVVAISNHHRRIRRHARGTPDRDVDAMRLDTVSPRV